MWPIKTILNATDFSEVSNEAYETACELAHQHHARLIVMHVTEKPVMSFIEKASELSPEERQQKLWETLRSPREQETGLEVEHRIEEGDPVKQIVRAAEDNHVDLIVMGASSRTGLMRWLTASVTDNIVRDAPCSVLLVKPARAHEAHEAGEVQETREASAAGYVPERRESAAAAPNAPPPPPRERPAPVGRDNPAPIGEPMPVGSESRVPLA
jgi:nucleotide-binding universal stress UspA family protein